MGSLNGRRQYIDSYVCSLFLGEDVCAEPSQQAPDELMGIERMHHLHPGTAMKLSLDVWIIIHLLHDGYYPKIASCSTNGDYLKALVLCGYQPGEVQMAAMFIKGISWLDEDVRCALAGGSRILHHLLFRFVDEVVRRSSVWIAVSEATMTGLCPGEGQTQCCLRYHRAGRGLPPLSHPVLRTKPNT